MNKNQAIIHPSAKIADNVSIGPWVYIGEDVSIGEGTVIEPHVVIKGPCKIGKNNHIFQFASIGELSQDKKDDFKEGFVEIGDDNTIRENVTINRGTEQGGKVTKLGNHNWLMAGAHIAHDCKVGNHVVFANFAAIAGHVTVHDYARLSGYAGINQFCTIGAYSFVSRATYIARDVLPYLIVAGYSAKTYGLNRIGLQRSNFTSETISYLRKAYKIIFRKGLTKREAISELEKNILPQCREVKLFIDALNNATNGITR